jgi:hypothetical protein
VIEIDTAEYNSGLRAAFPELKSTVGDSGFNRASGIEVFSLTNGDFEHDFMLQNGNAEESSIEFCVMVITHGKFSNRFVGYLNKGPRRKQFHTLLVFWPVTCGASTDTYLDMRRWKCLVDEPKSGAILWNYFLP